MVEVEVEYCTRLLRCFCFNSSCFCLRGKNCRVLALRCVALLAYKMVESGVSPGILPNFLSDYFIDIFGYIDLKNNIT